MGFLDGFLNLMGTVYGTESATDQDELNRRYNALEAQRNRDFQTSERLATQDFNVDMWNRNNEYNSLSSQIERAKEAGVSPASLFGSSSSSAIANPVTSSPMSGSSASFNSGLSSTIASMFSNLAKNVAETNLINKQATGQNQQNEFFNKTFEDRVKIISNNVLQSSAEIQRTLAEGAKINAETRTIEESFQWISKLNDAEYQARMQSLNNLRSENIRTIQEYLNLMKEGKWIDARNQSQLEVNESISNANNASAALSGEETRGQQLQNRMQEIEVAFSEATGMPLGSPEYQVQYWLYLNGQLPTYCDKVIRPITQSRWRPIDRYMPYGHYQQGRWNGRRGVFTNPTLYDDPMRRKYFELEDFKATHGVTNDYIRSGSSLLQSFTGTFRDSGMFYNH